MPLWPLSFFSVQKRRHTGGGRTLRKIFSLIPRIGGFFRAKNTLYSTQIPQLGQKFGQKNRVETRPGAQIVRCGAYPFFFA